MATQDLVLIPGLASDGALWRSTIDALGGVARCTVGDTLRDATLQDMARRILDEAPSKFALAGVSMGGIVAMEVVSLASARVTRLALVDTIAAPDSGLQYHGRQIVSLLASIPGVFETLIERSIASMVHPDTPVAVRTEAATMSLHIGPKVFARQNRAIAQRRDLRPVLSGIAVPTAVIAGRHDTKTPLRYSEEINRLVEGSTLDIIEHCGHLSPIEHPKAVADLLKRWLARET